MPKKQNGNQSEPGRRRKPSRLRRRNRRELERNTLLGNLSILVQDVQSSILHVYSSNWNVQAPESACSEENIPPPSHNVPHINHIPPSRRPEASQQSYCLAQVRTFQTTQILSQWNHQGQYNQRVITTGQQYRDSYISSRDQSIQIQEVEAVQNIHCTGTQ